MNASAPSAQEKLIGFLSASGLSPEDVPDWHWIDTWDLRSKLQLTQAINSDGIGIPYFDPDGKPILDQGVPYLRVRLLKPKKSDKGDSIRYLSLVGSRPQVYVPRKFKPLLSARQNPVLIITEGEKKAELICKLGYPALGLPGITMGRVRENPQDKTQPRTLVEPLVQAVRLAVDHGITRCIVLFDSDGAVVKTENGAPTPVVRFRKDGEQEVTDRPLKPLRKNKREWCQNDLTHWEAIHLAAALRIAFPGISFGAAFAQPRLIEEGNLASETPSAAVYAKEGVDDWALRIGADAFSIAIEQAALAARQASEDEIQSASSRTSGKIEGFDALGTDRGACVIWSKVRNQLERLDASALGKQAAILYACGPSYCEERWPKFSKEGVLTGIDLYAAQKAIINSCNNKGEWESARERGGGVWLDKSGLVINCKEGLYAATPYGLEKLSDQQRHSQGDYIYPAVGSYTAQIPQGNELSEWFEEQTRNTPDDLRRMLSHFGQWGGLHGADFRHGAQRALFCGWLLLQSYLGALDARPSIIISAPSGAGKSELARHMSLFLGGTALRIDDGASTSEPGIRQRLGRDAITLLIDEAEPGAPEAQVANQRAANLRRTLNLLRAAYSTTDSQGARSVAALKGTMDGRGTDYSLRTAAALFAIGRPDMEAADLNRSLLFELSKDGRAEKRPSDEGLFELGNRLRVAMWSRWDLFQGIFDRVQGAFQKRESLRGTEARLIKTWGSPIAAFLTLHESSAIVAQAHEERLSNGEVSPQTQARLETYDMAICDLLEHVKNNQMNDVPTGSDMNDAERAFDILMRASIEVQYEKTTLEGERRFSRARLTVQEVVYVCRLQQTLPDGPGDNEDGSRRSFEQEALRRYGLSFYVNKGKHYLHVSDGQPLRSILEGTTYATQNIETVLRRIPGAENRVQIRLGGGVRRRGTAVPLPDDVPENEEGREIPF